MSREELPLAGEVGFKVLHLSDTVTGYYSVLTA